MPQKVIIAGAGVAGSELHLDAFHEVPGVEVTALCDPNLEKARVVAGKKGVPRTYASLEEALNTHSADIVSICTPPSSHFSLCRLALERGCHVLLEKPLFQSMEEAEEIHALVNRTSCKFSAVHSHKYWHGIQRAARLVRERYIGDVVQIHAVRMINGEADKMISDPNCWCHKLPGGRWEELIPHPLYKAYQFMGPMRFVHLEMKRIHNRWTWLPADELEIILEGGTGYVSIKLSAHADNFNFMIVYGSHKYLYVDSDTAVDPLSITHRVQENPSFRNWLRNRLFSPFWTRPESSGQNAYAELFKDFIAYVRGERAEAPVDWQEAFNTLELGLQIGREIQRHQRR